MEMLEDSYLGFLGVGRQPQEAREVLPNSTKTELVVTGTVAEWKHFFDLRCADDAHPEMRRLAIPLREEFKNAGLI
jgi:thymidylate synthase (FAD)